MIFHIFLRSQIIKSKFWWFFVFICGITLLSECWIALLSFAKTLLLYRTITSNILVFFLRHWQFTGQQGKWEIILIPLYHFHPLTNIQTFICSVSFWDDYLSYSIAMHVINTLLPDDRCPPEEIRIWFSISFISLVRFMLDSNTVIPRI